MLLISASVSTLSSITLTACSTLSMDLIKIRLKPKLEDKNMACAHPASYAWLFVVLSYVVANYPTPPFWR